MGFDINNIASLEEACEVAINQRDGDMYRQIRDRIKTLQSVQVRGSASGDRSRINDVLRTCDAIIRQDTKSRGRLGATLARDLSAINAVLRGGAASAPQRFTDEDERIGGFYIGGDAEFPFVALDD